METTAEIKRLQSCINDLISVLALPAIWSGSESSQVLGTLLDVLLTMLRLDFAYARLGDANEGDPIKVLRLSSHRHSLVQPQQFAQALDRWLTDPQRSPRCAIPDAGGDGEISTTLFPLGLHREGDVLVAGSRRPDFPTEIEQLLLRVAANQAGIGLQEARRSGEQKRLAEMLEQRVAERTRRLTAVNDELRRSEAYLAEAQRLSRTGSFGWRPSTGDIIWSEETFRIFQYDRTATPTAELILQRVHPEDASLVKQTIERALQDGKNFEHEYRLLMPDGSVKHVHVVARDLTDESGSIEFVGAVMDVTVAKEAEDRIRLIINAVPALIWTARPDGSLDFISERWLGYAGINTAMRGSGELGGRTVHPDDIEQLREKWRVAVAGGTPFETEIRVRRFDGEYRWFLSRACPLRDRAGHILGWYGNDIDIEDRKRAEETLRDSEAYLTEAQRLTHTGSWAWQVAGRAATHLSEEWYRVYGFEPQAGVPNWEQRLQRIHPEDRAIWQATIDQAIREKSDYEVEFRILLPSGTVRYLHTVGHPVVSASGELVEFVGSSIDITQRKRAEALRDGESRILEKIARDAPLQETLEDLVRVVEAQFAGLVCSVLLLDHDGQHVRYGAAPNLPKPYTDAIEGLSIGPKAGSCGTAMYRREPVIVTDILQDPLWEGYRVVAEPYGFRACSSTPILAHSGKALGSFAMYYREPRSPSSAETRALEMATHLAGIAIERKLTHEQLQRSEAYLAEAQRLSHTGSWAFNAGEAIYWSEENFRIWGFNPQQGLPDRETVLRRIHPEDRDRVVEHIQKAVREKSDYAVEFRIVLPEGTVKHIRGLGRPVFSATGEFVEVVGTQLDVTERKRAEEERERLRHLQADLAHTNRVTTMGELTASLAHEIKQPIAAAVTNARTCLRWLRRDEPDVAEAGEAASRLVTDATRAAEIISRISLLFKKGAQPHDLVDVNELIQEMIVLLRSEASRYSISIRGELANDLPKIMADRVQLQQVLMNLMLNGIEAMKDMDTGGELTIESQQDDNHKLLISVGDTGVGLEAKQAEQIFNAFFTTKAQGTGMGLPISRSIIESHGGRMWATANPHRGATFHFTLPIKHAAPAAA